MKKKVFTNPLSVSLDDFTYHWIRKKSEEDEVSMSEVVRMIIHNWIKQTEI